MNWTTEQVLALAPDAASAKAGQGLAKVNKWLTLGVNEQAAWGSCQGSGKDPYRAQIELAEPAFKCSCPSRKFPCKHGLGLLLLLATQRAAFKDNAQPEWVSEWLASRSQRAEKKAAKVAEAIDKPIDEAAQTKRAEAREKKVSAGIAELQLWMNDLMCHGLAQAQTQPYSFWERPAARLVDAQAPGLARLVRELAGIAASGANGSESWQSRLLERLGKLQLLLEGYQRLESLPSVTQADIRQTIGWTINQDELLKETGKRDLWLVLGRRIEHEDKLRVQRSWLWGMQTDTPALVLHFSHAAQPLDVSLVPGQTFEGELVFFPSGYAQRALIKHRSETINIPAPLPGFLSLTEATAAFAQALAQQPWLERFPFALRRVTPRLVENNWFITDSENRCVPLHPRFGFNWELLALSGGHSVSIFGEWDGDALWPLCVQAENQWVQFRDEGQ